MSKAKFQPVVEAKQLVSDDLAYVIPMGAFLLFNFASAQWPSLYVPLYVAKAVVVAILLAVFWRQYTKIRWNGWWLGVIVGVIGIFQWVPMQLGLQHLTHGTVVEKF